MQTDFEAYITELRKNLPKGEKHEHPVYECEKCKDTGWIYLIDGSGQEVARQCECMELKRAKRLLINSGISQEFHLKDFEHFETRQDPQLVNAKKKAIEYSKVYEQTEHTRHNSIMFCGQVGSGKTHLGIAICNVLMARSIPVIYMPYRNAVTKIKQSITDELLYTRELEKYMKARVLYIDDLLKGKITDSDKNILYELINHRYMSNMPLIISTELGIDDLLDFDEAIGSRIIEMCRGNIIQLKGKELNYRLR